MSKTIDLPAAKVWQRLQWQPPEWSSHSILQIRLTPKAEGKTTISFHQEKLPSPEDRRVLREHWRRVASLIAEMPASGPCEG